MQLLKKVIPFDVDETLIGVGGPEEITFFNPNHGIYETTKVYQKHVDRIIKLKESGHAIIVWSMSGGEYAKNVVEAIGIEEYVDIVSDKPIEYYDDMKVGWEWMCLRKFL